MLEINLLPKETNNKKTTARVEKWFKIGIIIFVGFSIIGSGGLFILSQLSSRNVALQRAAITKEEAELASNQVFEDNLAVLAAKSQALVSIFRAQPRYSRLLDAFSAKVPSEIRIVEVTALSPTRLTVSGAASSYLALSKFLKVLGSDTEGVFTGVTLSNVILDSQTSLLRFTMDVAVKEGSLTHIL